MQTPRWKTLQTVTGTQGWRLNRPQLAAAGYKPSDVTHLALSHYHGDHVANANAFAGSTWIVQEVERKLWTSHREVAPLIEIWRPAVPGIKRILVNHPDFLLEASDAQVREYVRLGAYIELGISQYLEGEHSYGAGTYFLFEKGSSHRPRTLTGVRMFGVNLQGVPVPG